VESCCEFAIKPSGSIKCWETIEWPNSWGTSRVVLSSVEVQYFVAPPPPPRLLSLSHVNSWTDHNWMQHFARKPWGHEVTHTKSSHWDLHVYDRKLWSDGRQNFYIRSTFRNKILNRRPVMPTETLVPIYIPAHSSFINRCVFPSTLLFLFWVRWDNVFVRRALWDYCNGTGWEKCGAIARMRIVRVNRSTRIKPAHFHIIRHKSYTIWTWIEPECPRWEAGD
jgi:hypothetical protein